MSELGIGPWEIFVLLVVLAVAFSVQRVSNVVSLRRRPPAVVREQQPVVVVPRVSCPACQTANPETNRFCSVCGASMTPAPPEPAAPPITCPSCNTQNPATQAFCGQCGTSLRPAAA